MIPELKTAKNKLENLMQRFKDYQMKNPADMNLMMDCSVINFYIAQLDKRQYSRNFVRRDALRRCTLSE
jgi:hypothetical protein